MAEGFLRSAVARSPKTGYFLHAASVFNVAANVDLRSLAAMDRAKEA